MCKVNIKYTSWLTGNDGRFIPLLMIKINKQRRTRQCPLNSWIVFLLGGIWIERENQYAGDDVKKCWAGEPRGWHCESEAEEFKRKMQWIRKQRVALLVLKRKVRISPICWRTVLKPRGFVRAFQSVPRKCEHLRRSFREDALKLWRAKLRAIHNLK